MKIAFSGWRYWNEFEHLEKLVDWLEEWDISSAVLGDAKGLDTLMKYYCIIRGIPYVVKYADWDTYGYKAGPVRNGEMLDEKPDYLFAFPHESSKGTVNMMKQAMERGIPIETYNLGGS